MLDRVPYPGTQDVEGVKKTISRKGAKFAKNIFFVFFANFAPLREIAFARPRIFWQSLPLGQGKPSPYYSGCGSAARRYGFIHPFLVIQEYTGCIHSSRGMVKKP